MAVMRHPGLPDGQEITVEAVSVPHYARSGWQQVPDEDLAQREADADAAARAAHQEQIEAVSPAPEPPKTSGRKGATKTDEEKS
jgi:hypothetical protein